MTNSDNVEIAENALRFENSVFKINSAALSPTFRETVTLVFEDDYLLTLE